MARNAALIAAAVVVVALAAYFFRNQFARNWQQVRDSHFSLSYPLLAASVLCILASYLISTAMWQFGINRLGTGHAFSYRASIGMVNATQLSKYIPGRVWGYAMQMVLAERRAVSAAAVLYVNVVFTLSKSFISVILGVVYLCLSSRLLPRIAAFGILIAVLAVYAFFLLFNGRFFNLLLRITQRLLRRQIVPFDLRLSAMLWLQLLGAVATIVFGLSAVVASRAIGFATPPSTAWSVFAGLPLADTVGFFAFFAPGGLGVREGLFNLMLNELQAGALALILPIVMRLISMSADALLGLMGLVFLSRLVKGDSA